MKSKLIHTDENDQQTYAIILSEGDEVMGCLESFSKENRLGVCHFTAIGAFSRSEFGYFDLALKDYLKIPLDEQAEVLVLTGDITLNDGKYQVHAHAVAGLQDGSTKGGHLIKGYVNPTLEVILTESPVHLYRKYDEKCGLSLIDIKD